MLPANEAQRLNALRRYQILDTPPEPAFDRIAEMAANIFHVPMAGISLVDEERVWIKARVGTNVDQVAREAGLCSSAMLSQGVYHLRDAAHDERASREAWYRRWMLLTPSSPVSPMTIRASRSSPYGNAIISATRLTFR